VVPQLIEQAMKITELQLDEIERLSPSGFSGGKDYLDSYGREKSVRELPGGSGLLYSITKDGGGDFIIKMWDRANKGEFKASPIISQRPSYYTRREWDRYIERAKQRDASLKAEYDAAPGKLIGQLTVDSVGRSFPVPGAVKVGTITVDEDYRGGGIAKALYGIVLTIMKRPLIAGSSQTPGGRRNWMSLSQIPGVQMKGYMRIDDEDLKTRDPATAGRFDDKRWIARQNKVAEKSIDTIMGKLGGEYMGKNSYGTHYFAFDVRPDTTKQELKAYVDTNLSKVYSSGYSSGGGLYAVWVGQ
jgi:ribosomal protein S18 acetylase RimI-like enzyme